MERDFMGLGFQMKQKIPHEITDSSMGMRKVGFEAFASAKEKKRKVGFEAFASAGLMTKTTGDAVQPSISSYSSIMQQNMVLEKQEYRYTALTLPPKAVDLPVRRRYQEARRAASNLWNETVHQSFISPAGHNLVCSTNPQPMPLTSAFQASNAVVGTTELRNSSISAGAPTQLTVFYAGSVYVYEDVSSEKAQAIMFLAGNGPQSTVQTPAVRPSASVDCSALNWSHSKSSFSSQICMSSPPQSVGGSVFTDDAVAVRTIGTPGSLSSIQEFPKPSTLSQCRQASIIRFLERRKKR